MGRPPKTKSFANKIPDSSNGLAYSSVQTAADISTSPTSMPLNSVQSHLMDFLAENLASDSLNVFDTLPSIAPDILVDEPNKADILPLLQHEDDTGYLLQDISNLKSENIDINDQLYDQLQTEASLLHDTLGDINL